MVAVAASLNKRWKQLERKTVVVVRLIPHASPHPDSKYKFHSDFLQNISIPSNNNLTPPFLTFSQSSVCCFFCHIRESYEGIRSIGAFLFSRVSSSRVSFWSYWWIRSVFVYLHYHFMEFDSRLLIMGFLLLTLMGICKWSSIWVFVGIIVLNFRIFVFTLDFLQCMHVILEIIVFVFSSLFD